MTQAELAEAVAALIWHRERTEVAFDRSHLAKLERGVHTWPSARYRAALREILGASSDTDLGFECAASARTARPLALDEEADVNRRQFVITSLGVPAFVHEALATLRTPRPLRSISSSELRQLEEAVAGLEQADAAVGGGALCQTALSLHHQIRAWRNEGAKSLKVGAALQRLHSDIGAWVGWLALDAGDDTQSSQYLTDAIVQARVSDDPGAEVRAMSYLCLLLCRTGQQREALQCALAGARIAESMGATPRVVAIMHMRAALAHAYAGEARDFERATARAYRTLGAGPHEDDPLWSQYATPAEFDALAAGALGILGDHRAAMEALAPLAENPDPKYRRNSVGRRVQLAVEALGAGDISQAAKVALSVLPDVQTIQSGRISVRLAQVHVGVAPLASTNPFARDYVEAYRLAGNS